MLPGDATAVLNLLSTSTMARFAARLPAVQFPDDRTPSVLVEVIVPGMSRLPLRHMAGRASAFPPLELGAVTDLRGPFSFLRHECGAPGQPYMLAVFR